MSLNSNSSVPVLKWKAHPREHQRAIGRMYKDVLNGSDPLTDVMLFSSDGEFVEAHSTILTMISPYFYRIFSKIQRIKRPTNTMIIVGNVKVSILRYLLRFVYTGEASVPSQHIKDVKQLAKVFEIEGLFSACDQISAVPITNSAGLPRIESFKGEFDTAVSEDEAGICSEPEMKVENTNNDNTDLSDCDYNGTDADETAGSSCEGRTRLAKKKRRVIVQNVSRCSSKSEGNEQERRESLYEQKVDPKTGLLVGYRGTRQVWTKMADEISEVELERDWNKWYAKKSRSKTYTVYYCRHAKEGYMKCPVLLKKEVWNLDGEINFYLNDAQHGAHRETPLGLLKEEKDFINCLCNGDRYLSPTEILRAFMKAGKPQPQRKKLENYLYNLRKERERRRVGTGTKHTKNVQGNIQTNLSNIKRGRSKKATSSVSIRNNQSTNLTTSATGSITVVRNVGVESNSSPVDVSIPLTLKSKDTVIRAINSTTFENNGSQSHIPFSKSQDQGQLF